MKTLDKIKFVNNYRKKQGLKKTISKSIESLTASPPKEIPSKTDIIGFYNDILSQPRGFGLKLTDKNLPLGTMTWVIPDFSRGSGGHINLARMSKLLSTYKEFKNQHIVIMEPHRWSSAKEAQIAFQDAFEYPNVTVSLGLDSLEPCKYLMATGWQTAYAVAKYKDAIHKLYFVQDFEPMFFANGSEAFFAENTYKLGLTGITAGSWLAKKLSSEYGMTTFPYSFACDLDLYKPSAKKASVNQNIFFYARPVTPRRCFELGLLALNEICKKHDDVAVIFAGWDVSNYNIPFKHLNAGEIQLSELPDLYSQCDASLVLSATNLSLLPMEIAACKGPLVINKLPQAEWLFNETEAKYCEMSVTGIVDALNDVLINSKETNKRTEKAYKRALKGSWEKEAAKVAKFLISLEQ